MQHIFHNVLKLEKYKQRRLLKIEAQSFTRS